MVQSRTWNGNAKSKLNQDGLRSLQDHELDRVSGGVGGMSGQDPIHAPEKHARGIELSSPGCARAS
jgi:hypothetical protein